MSCSRSSCIMTIYYGTNIFIEYLRLSFRVINYRNELTLGTYRSTKESSDKLGMTDLGRRRSGNRSRRLRTRVETLRLGMKQKGPSPRDSNLARATNASNVSSRISFVATVRWTRKKNRFDHPDNWKGQINENCAETSRRIFLCVRNAGYYTWIKKVRSATSWANNNSPFQSRRRRKCTGVVLLLVSVRKTNVYTS